MFKSPVSFRTFLSIAAGLAKELECLELLPLSSWILQVNEGQWGVPGSRGNADLEASPLYTPPFYKPWAHFGPLVGQYYWLPIAPSLPVSCHVREARLNGNQVLMVRTGNSILGSL